MDIEKLNISQARDKIREKPLDELPEILKLIEEDDRKGIKALKGTILRRIRAEKDRIKKKDTLLYEERKLWRVGYKGIGGMDEVGRGPLAGPVVAACVVFEPGTYIDGVDDSKKLSPSKRDRLFHIIMKKAQVVGIGRVDSREIDVINIFNATKKAMDQALSQCISGIDFLLVDAMDSQFSVPYRSLVKGDQRSHSIAAASIVAKVTRDREMIKKHKEYPDYGFDKHKGYGTQVHIDSIKELGLCPIHRRTFTHRFVSEE